MNHFQNNDKEYLRIKNAVEDKVYATLSNGAIPAETRYSFSNPFDNEQPRTIRFAIARSFSGD